MKSTKDLIMEKLTVLPPRRTMYQIIKERGGIMKISQAGEFPRNRTQVYNINRKLKNTNGNTTLPSNDPLLQVITKAKEEQKGRIENALIREIPLFPEPIVFLVFCVLGVDANVSNCRFLLHFHHIQKPYVKNRQRKPSCFHWARNSSQTKTLHILQDTASSHV